MISNLNKNEIDLVQTPLIFVLKVSGLVLEALKMKF